MFGLFSLSTLALIGMYGYGFVLLMKAGLNSGKSWMAAAAWAAVWPLSAWKVLNDLWRSPPPAE